jgi:HAE1 family hydrophobic/amphiphilic exporter-1
MAIAVIGGLITSTLLSLLYVPVVFVLMDGLKVRSERLMHRVFGGSAHTAHPPASKSAVIDG